MTSNATIAVFREIGEVERLARDGYLRVERDFTAHFGSGEHYVYLWRHDNGAVFYVGSGKNDRYSSINGNERFLEELDQGDAVIYIVADGMEEEFARDVERLISGTLSCSGICLTNSDNIVSPQIMDDFRYWAKSLREIYSEDEMIRVERAAEWCIVRDPTKKDWGRIREGFLDDWGARWFSKDRKYKNQT